MRLSRASFLFFPNGSVSTTRSMSESSRASPRAEEDHLLGTDLGDNGLDHLVKEFVDDGYHSSVFLFIKRQVSGSCTSRKSNLR